MKILKTASRTLKSGGKALDGRLLEGKREVHSDGGKEGNVPFPMADFH